MQSNSCGLTNVLENELDCINSLDHSIEGNITAFFFFFGSHLRLDQWEDDPVEGWLYLLLS